jgi:Na+-transporting NADH:ubiquinone oxidoreductase subunit NqrF
MTTIRIQRPPSARSIAPPIVFDAVSGETLSRAIWLSGRVSPVPLCAGLGRCGHCRVRFVSNAPPPLPAEEDILSQNDIASGWRLACRRQAPDSPIPLDLELPPSEKGEEAVAARRAIMPEPLAVAVNLGTTSVCCQALVAEGRGRVKLWPRGVF